MIRVKIILIYFQFHAGTLSYIGTVSNPSQSKQNG